MMMPGTSNADVLREIGHLVRLAEEAGETDYYSGKRGEARVADGLPLEVTRDPQNASSAWNVTMQDVSRRGVSFWSKRDIPTRTNIFIRAFSADGPRAWIPAFVKHSTGGLRGHLIGAAFTVSVDQPAESAPGSAQTPGSNARGAS